MNHSLTTVSFAIVSSVKLCVAIVHWRQTTLQVALPYDLGVDRGLLSSCRRNFSGEFFHEITKVDLPCTVSGTYSAGRSHRFVGQTVLMAVVVVDAEIWIRTLKYSPRVMWENL